MTIDGVDRTFGAHDCVYATAGWGIHDERWVSALLEVGLTPHVISLGRDVPDALELRQAVTAAAAGGLPVLAGPLPGVTSTRKVIVSPAHCAEGSKEPTPVGATPVQSHAALALFRGAGTSR